jgi:hypothetical protein
MYDQGLTTFFDSVNRPLTPQEEFALRKEDLLAVSNAVRDTMREVTRDVNTIIS